MRGVRVRRKYKVSGREEERREEREREREREL